MFVIVSTKQNKKSTESEMVPKEHDRGVAALTNNPGPKQTKKPKPH